MIAYNVHERRLQRQTELVHKRVVIIDHQRVSTIIDRDFILVLYGS